jgi:FAD/FMN-containing dehydrogenase
MSMLGAAVICTDTSAHGSSGPTSPSPLGHPDALSALSTAVSREDPNYEVWRQSMVWQRNKPPRRPDLIVQVDSAKEVVAAVSYAREHGLQVATRCGGHSTSACFLRGSGMLIDVSRLNGVEAMDRSRKEVIAGPGVIARELNARLLELGLAFPTTHCGMVPMGGFLLGGGLGLNGNAWGEMSTFNIVGAEVVTADGVIRSVSARENPELFWALRGAGPGLFFVVTKLHLKAYDLPQAIVGNTLTFAFNDIEDVTAALTEIAPKMDQDVEILGYVGPADPELRAKCPAGDCRLAVGLHSNAYATSGVLADQKVRPLLDHPIAKRAIAKDLGRSTTIERLYFEEELGFGQRRWLADNVYTNRARDIAAVLRARMPECPSSDAEAVLLYKGSPRLHDAACSMTGDFYSSFYMLWDNPTEDPVMSRYLRSLYKEIVPLGVGSYINEMDQEGRPGDIKTCYSQSAWSRLQQLRAKWDPGHVFHDFYGAA